VRDTNQGTHPVVTYSHHLPPSESAKYHTSNSLIYNTNSKESSKNNYSALNLYNNNNVTKTSIKANEPPKLYLPSQA
jgi:hypothetical protein